MTFDGRLWWAIESSGTSGRSASPPGESPPLVSDTVVMSRFRLLERIGSGGMGTVYRAYDERLQRHVAVKEIQCAGSDRVLREAQAAARLNHPAIVTLYELGERAGRALLVSELVEGETLGELAQGGAISDRDVAEIGADVCDALEHAHARGVVHRDVKPENVMVPGRDGAGLRAKLMDFGIASVADARTLTATGETLGTLVYMAPEQARGERAGAAADVYALGLTLYECWAGANPVAGRNPAQTARRIGRVQPSLGELRPDLPPALVAAIDGCLLPDAGERPALGRLRRELRRQTRALDARDAVPAAQPAAESEAPAERPLVRPLTLVLVAVALASLAGPGGRSGLALALGALVVPTLLVARTPAVALVPLLAVPLGAVGALAAVLAVVVLVADRHLERALLGGLAFCAYVAGVAAVGSGDGIGLVEPAPPGWSGSTVAAARDVLGALVDPALLAGCALYAVAAVSLGLVLRTPVAVATVGSVLWAAGMQAGLSPLGDGSLGGQAPVALAAALAAIALEWRRRETAPPPDPRPLASSRAALEGGGATAVLP